MAVTNYYTVNGSIIGESTGSSVINYATDALGSVTGTLVGGQLVNTYAYKPYGALLAKTGTGADPKHGWNGSSGYRPTGRAQSDYYVRARHYGSAPGRWSTTDPLWPQERPYDYVSCNAATRGDPLGLQDYPWGCRLEGHPCGNDPLGPCHYAEEHGDDRGDDGWGICCNGVFYICASSKITDPEERAGVLFHERCHFDIHVKMLGKNGCEGVDYRRTNLWRRDAQTWIDMFGSDLSFQDDQEECTCYISEIGYYLGQMYKKCGRMPPEGSPGFAKWYACAQKYVGFITRTCVDGEDRCTGAGRTSDWHSVCDRWISLENRMMKEAAEKKHRRKPPRRSAAGGPGTLWCSGRRGAFRRSRHRTGAATGTLRRVMASV